MRDDELANLIAHARTLLTNLAEEALSAENERLR